MYIDRKSFAKSQCTGGVTQARQAATFDLAVLIVQFRSRTFPEPRGGGSNQAEIKLRNNGRGASAYSSRSSLARRSRETCSKTTNRGAIGRLRRVQCNAHSKQSDDGRCSVTATTGCSSSRARAGWLLQGRSQGPQLPRASRASADQSSRLWMLSRH